MGDWCLCWRYFFFVDDILASARVFVPNKLHLDRLETQKD